MAVRPHIIAAAEARIATLLLLLLPPGCVGEGASEPPAEADDDRPTEEVSGFELAPSDHAPSWEVGPRASLSSDPVLMADVGCIAEHGFTIRSVGSEPLTIASVAVQAGDGWGLPALELPVTLGVGQELHLPVTWSVLLTGEVAAVVDVLTDAGEEPDQVELVGVGVQPAPQDVVVVVVPRADVLYVNSAESSGWCEGFPNPVDLGYAVPGQLAEALVVREVDWAMMGMGGDLPDLVPDPDSAESPLVVTGASPDPTSDVNELEVWGGAQSGVQQQFWAIHGGADRRRPTGGAAARREVRPVRPDQARRGRALVDRMERRRRGRRRRRRGAGPAVGARLRALGRVPVSGGHAAAGRLHRRAHPLDVR